MTLGDRIKGAREDARSHHDPLSRPGPPARRTKARYPRTGAPGFEPRPDGPGIAPTRAPRPPSPRPPRERPRPGRPGAPLPDPAGTAGRPGRDRGGGYHPSRSRPGGRPGRGSGSGRPSLRATSPDCRATEPGFPDPVPRRSTRAAPRLRASIPRAPVPAKQSTTRAPGSRGASMENRASFTRSAVGRSSSPGRVARRRPRNAPPITRTPVRDAPPRVMVLLAVGASPVHPVPDTAPPGNSRRAVRRGTAGPASLIALNH